MKHRSLALLAVVLLAAVSTRADDYPVKEAFEHRGAFSPTGSLRLENVNGDVEIRTWDRNEILIAGEKRAKTEEELKAIDLRMVVDESKANIKVRLPKRSGRWFAGNTIRAAVRFTITVPTTAVLDGIETVNASVTVGGVRGPVRIETVNGSIRASDLGGNADLETVNGQLTATFARVVAGQQLAFETVNGSVAVVLPADAGVVLRTSVVNGRVNCELPITLTTSGKRSLNGTVGDGRATLHAETVNGSITIKQG
jgi:DUF4097 and DUF4098 domain-containing protein YvlB